MSQILLVRHGQASWGQRDYDQLSELGVQQSKILGEALAARGVTPHVVLTGGMRRQQQTAEAAVAAAGWTPALEDDGGWAEYDHQAIIEAHRPAYRSMTVMRADLARALQPRRAFQQMFEQSVGRWTAGEHDGDYAESFSAFGARLEDAVARLTARLQSGQTAVVFTSAGAMSWATASLLGGGVPVWANLNKVMVNTGITKVVTGRSGTTVVAINDHSHLETGDPSLVTTR